MYTHTKLQWAAACDSGDIGNNAFKTSCGKVAATISHLVLPNISLVHDHLQTRAYLSSKIHRSTTYMHYNLLTLTRCAPHILPSILSGWGRPGPTFFHTALLNDTPQVARPCHHYDTFNTHASLFFQTKTTIKTMFIAALQNNVCTTIACSLSWIPSE